MKYIAREQIKYLFGNPKHVMQNGLWFSGYEDEGEYKVWHDNGQLRLHCFVKKLKKHGEYKLWNKTGELICHRLYKNDKVIKDYLK